MTQIGGPPASAGEGTPRPASPTASLCGGPWRDRGRLPASSCGGPWRAVADLRPTASPSTNRSQSPAWPIAHRACLRERDESLHERTRRPAWMVISPRQRRASHAARFRLLASEPPRRGLWRIVKQLRGAREVPMNRRRWPQGKSGWCRSRIQEPGNVPLMGTISATASRRRLARSCRSRSCSPVRQETARPWPGPPAVPSVPPGCDRESGARAWCRF